MNDDSDRHDREAILARRRRFITAALTGLATSTLATACPCLDVAPQPEPSTGPDDDSGGSTSGTDGSGTADSGSGGSSTSG